VSGRPDGGYRFLVRATDALGNQGPAVSSDYALDTVAPGAPAIVTGPGSPNRDRSPSWAFTAEPGATVECRLDLPGALVSDWAVCSSPRSYQLGGADGSYALSLRATDAAGNTGPSSNGSYELDTTPPGAPRITDGPAQRDDDPRPTWSFTGEAGATFECALALGREAVSERSACASPRQYNLVDDPNGEYAFTVRARDVAGNVGDAAGAHYMLERTDPGDDSVPTDAVQPDPEPAAADPIEADPAGVEPGGDLPGLGGEPAEGLEPQPDAGSEGDPAGGVLSPEKFDPGTVSLDEPRGEGGAPVLKALGRAVKAVAKNADKSVFPGVLAAIVMCFFAVQNRIDRNDPKLGLAPVFADPDLEFRPPEPKE
ncbi:MAG TPA: hypothetical protein VHG69_10710, partial [Thermoleophilaceae bacterium]|nr:hypothetical protein [Thermoleophilaceae bacterium]